MCDSIDSQHSDRAMLNTTLSIGVASFSLRFYLYAGDTFLAQAKACYSMLWLNDKVVLRNAKAQDGVGRMSDQLSAQGRGMTCLCADG